MELHLAYGSVAEEAAAKVESMMALPDDAIDALRRECARRLPPDGVEQVERTLAFVESLESRVATHPTLRAYLAHPVRVAHQALRMEPQPQVTTVLIGLLHNAFEVSGLHEDDLAAHGFSPEIGGSIRLLTVDRSREHHAEYQRLYHARIEAAGERLALLRCVDRIDNLLGLEIFDQAEVRANYLDFSMRFVVPVAERLSDALADYLRAVIDYMRTHPCDPARKGRYDAFLSSLSPAAGRP